MNVIFLDYDGVVNTVMWYWNENKQKWKSNYSYPSDNKVNNFQAVQWVSEFCEKFHYSIVVSSTWRLHDNYKECLINGGLREGIEIIGKTPKLYDKERGEEISQYLKAHPEIKNYLIFDDDSDMTIHMDKLVKCTQNGFGIVEFQKAKELHEKFNDKNNK